MMKVNIADPVIDTMSHDFINDYYSNLVPCFFLEQSNHSIRSTLPFYHPIERFRYIITVTLVTDLSVPIPWFTPVHRHLRP